MPAKSSALLGDSIGVCKSNPRGGSTSDNRTFVLLWPGVWQPAREEYKLLRTAAGGRAVLRPSRRSADNILLANGRVNGYYLR